jgi:alginate O-acetyltransferase complex protein AlgI
VRHDDLAGRRAPPLAWTAIALLCGPYVAAWAWMWLLAVAGFAACKWATWWPYRFDSRATCGRHAAFLAAYAGMDAERFLHGAPPSSPPRAAEWLVTIAAATAGATLIWLAARLALPSGELLAGWIGMTGLVLLLHFGLLDLLALVWRMRRIDARPLMRSPTRARSLADFWGNRWNTGFRALAHDLVFDPLRRTLGPAGATAAVFLASGAVHDLVISLPARGGHGLPTLYFAIQFAGLSLERARRARRAFARHAALGRLFTIAVIVAPLPLLFHEKFVRNVVLPFLNAIGGLS